MFRRNDPPKYAAVAADRAADRALVCNPGRGGAWRHPHRHHAKKGEHVDQPWPYCRTKRLSVAVSDAFHHVRRTAYVRAAERRQQAAHSTKPGQRMRRARSVIIVCVCAGRHVRDL